MASQSIGLIVVLAVLIVILLPHWRFWGGSAYGYWPSGGLGLILVILLILVLMGVI